MIRIPLINKVLGINTVNNKASRKMNAIGKQIGEMVKDPRWVAFIEKNKHKETLGQYLERKQREGEGTGQSL